DLEIGLVEAWLSEGGVEDQSEEELFLAGQFHRAYQGEFNSPLAWAQNLAEDVRVAPGYIDWVADQTWHTFRYFCGYRFAFRGAYEFLRLGGSSTVHVL